MTISVQELEYLITLYEHLLTGLMPKLKALLQFLKSLKYHEVLELITLDADFISWLGFPVSLTPLDLGNYWVIVAEGYLWMPTDRTLTVMCYGQKKGAGEL